MAGVVWGVVERADVQEQADVLRWVAAGRPARWVGAAGRPVHGDLMAAIERRQAAEHLVESAPLGRLIGSLARKYGLAVPGYLARQANDGSLDANGLRRWLRDGRNIREADVASNVRNILLLQDLTETR